MRDENDIPLELQRTKPKDLKTIGRQAFTIQQLEAEVETLQKANASLLSQIERYAKKLMAVAKYLDMMKGELERF